ncbi:protein FAM47E isoform X2 [Acanthopagrus latus]|uniref:protein FAM47E isoform X2 n=1 Tax=Acanthopagrus latus TaxID=8177 RepID=UPI00187C3D6E|nr:protein FAM47E isoform X2 [Acanthopagrus latus]
MESKNSRPIFPWYKERLQTKYLKAQTNKISSASSCCRFVNTSLEDFGDCSSVPSGAQTGVSPVIFHDAPNNNSSQKQRRSVSKEHACFSKQMIQKQIRREYVAAVEKKLKQHPLVKFPHYKDHMTPELFDKVVSVLDPDVCVSSASALPTPAKEDEEDTEPRKEDVGRKKHNKISKVQSPTPRNPYVLQMKGNGIKNGRTVAVNQLCANQDMTSAARLFTKWFASPDEETNVSDKI